MLFSFSAQHVLFFYHLVVVSAIVPRGVIERSSLSTTFLNNSKNTNSTSTSSHSLASSSLYTSISTFISTSSQLSSEATLASTNSKKVAIFSPSLATGYTSTETPAVSVLSNTIIGSKSSKETSNTNRTPSYDVSLDGNSKYSSHSSTKTTPKSKTTSSTVGIVATSKDSLSFTIHHKSSLSAISKTNSKSLAGNSTLEMASSHASAGTSSTSKKGTIKKVTSTSHKVHVTSMPSYSMFGNQTITKASCKSTTLGKSAEHYCRVMIGTVQLHYWPTDTAAMNRSYPSTIYLQDYDITMTSPSVYFAINTMKATDLCGKQVGPTIKNYAVGYDVTDVYTMQPFANTKVKTRMGDPKQLQLSDLRTDCPQTTILPEDIFDYLETNHVVLGEDSRCNPILSWPTDLRLAAGEFWTTCGRHWGGKLGIFDPPIPVTACTGDASTCLYGSTKISSAPATTTELGGPTPAPADQITTIPAVPIPTISAGPSSTGNEGFASLVVSAKSFLASSSSTAALSEDRNRMGPATVFFPKQSTSTAVAVPSFESSIEISPNPADPSYPPTASASITSDTKSHSTSPSLPSPTVIAIVGSKPFFAVPGSSGIILPSGFTASVGAVVTITDALNNPVIMSEDSSNIFVGSESYIVPTALSVLSNLINLANIDVVNGQIISIATGSSISGAPIATVAGQTISSGGSAATLYEGKIASLGVDGVVIQGSGGYCTTIPIPNPTAPVTPASLIDIGILGGHTISVGDMKGNSVAIVAGQTLSYGGPIATLSGGNIVSLGVNGVVIQAPSGKATTIPIPKTASASASDKAIKTLESGAPTTSSSALDAASASRTGSATLVQSDNSGQRIEALIWLSWFLVGWIGLCILR
ncbi:hypothetical protein SBOR_2271 [Sclerotinia borealis F-4128]|uniref:Uncharacterized protein n=1 Tax=Sclerotinia borealis (strain F-4128) TaxID=1432307 RepID=W9CNE1_SCLBF|nr:hypothetical protein SBOR_2271 [Sclerotinia borealis F-4128]